MGVVYCFPCALYSILVQHACNDHAWLTSEWIRQVGLSSFSVLTHSTSSGNPFTANDLCFCYSFCSLVICTAIRAPCIPFYSLFKRGYLSYRRQVHSVLALLILSSLCWCYFIESRLLRMSSREIR